MRFRATLRRVISWNSPELEIATAPTTFNGLRTRSFRHGLWNCGNFQAPAAFTLYIKLDAPMSVATKAEFPDPRVRTPTILIVEDEPLIRLSISSFLQECGFIVLQASNVSEAIDLVSQDLVKIDLVFSDVQIPGSIDGFGLAIWIRLHRPGTPIILASGYSRIVDIAQELCAGAPFFKKPYDLNIVVAKIRQTLDARKTGT